MDSAELTEWKAFANIEPLLGRRLDMAAAQVTCAALNPWLKEALEVSQVIPEWEEMVGGEEGRLLEVMRDAEKFALTLRPVPEANPQAGKPSLRKRRGKPPSTKPVQILRQPKKTLEE